MRLSLASLLLSLAAPVFAQSTPPAPSPSAQAPGPAMQETISFISDLNEKQGKIRYSLLQFPEITTISSHSIQLQAPCSLVIGSSSTTFSASTTRFTRYSLLLDLARSEPTSVAIKPISATPEVFSLQVEQAYRQILSSNDPVDDSPAVPLPPIAEGENVSGTIKSNNGTGLTFVAEDGRLMSFTPGKRTKLENWSNGKGTPAAFSDFAAGDHLILFQKSATHYLNSNAGPAQKGYETVVVLAATDNAAITRMAKALIHAIVLCHKDDKPSPF